MKHERIQIFILAAAMASWGCSDSPPGAGTSPTTSIGVSPTPTSTETGAATSSMAPTPTKTSGVTSTPTGTSGVTPTPTVTSGVTPTPTPTGTQGETPRVTPTSVAITPTATVTQTVAVTPSDPSGVDADGDGYSPPEDCDDSDASLNPSTEWFQDQDRDGYGDSGSVQTQCEPPEGHVREGGDCDPNNPTIHPFATEVCGDGVDQDCDGEVDERCDGSSGGEAAAVLNIVNTLLLGSGAPR